MPRSGTTLIEQILDAHRDAHGAGERVALGQAFFGLGRGDGRPPFGASPHLTPPRSTRRRRHYLAALHALAPDAKRVVDKMPGNFNYLGLVGLLLPGAKIIYCARDPRDIGLSIFTFRFHGVHGYAHDLADLGWYIAQHERLMTHWKTALPNQIMTVRLSDWVDDFDGTLARLLAHVDLPPDPNCARFYESDSRVKTVSRAQVRQPINSRGLGRWRAYANELEPLIKELERAGIPFPEDTGTTRPQQDATHHAADDEAKLRIWKPDDPAVALGLAVEYLIKSGISPDCVRQLVARTDRTDQPWPLLFCHRRAAARSRLPRLGAHGRTPGRTVARRPRDAYRRRLPSRQLRHRQRLGGGYHRSEQSADR